MTSEHEGAVELRSLPPNPWRHYVDPAESLAYFATLHDRCASCGRRQTPRVHPVNGCGVCDTCEPRLMLRQDESDLFRVTSLRLEYMRRGKLYGHCVSFKCDVCGVLFRHAKTYWAHPFVLTADGRVRSGGEVGQRGVRCEYCWSEGQTPQRSTRKDL